MERKAIVNRKTRETDISLELDLDGSGQYDIDTGVGFFDHMLSGFARHGFFDLKLKVTGDLYVDSHHTIEDTGIVLGKAIAQALVRRAGKVHGHQVFHVLPVAAQVTVFATQDSLAVAVGHKSGGVVEVQLVLPVGVGAAREQAQEQQHG